MTIKTWLSSKKIRLLYYHRFQSVFFIILCNKVGYFFPWSIYAFTLSKLCVLENKLMKLTVNYLSSAPCNLGSLIFWLFQPGIYLFVFFYFYKEFLFFYCFSFLCVPIVWQFWSIFYKFCFGLIKNILHFFLFCV